MQSKGTKKFNSAKLEAVKEYENETVDGPFPEAKHLNFLTKEITLKAYKEYNSIKLKQDQGILAGLLDLASVNDTAIEYQQLYERLGIESEEQLQASIQYYFETGVKGIIEEYERSKHLKEDENQDWVDEVEDDPYRSLSEESLSPELTPPIGSMQQQKQFLSSKLFIDLDANSREFKNSKVVKRVSSLYDESIDTLSIQGFEFVEMSEQSLLESVKKKVKGPQYVLYNIVVKCKNGEKWSVRRRYNDFFEFHKSLFSLFDSQREALRKLPKLPPKYFIYPWSTDHLSLPFVQNRKTQLETYLEEILDFPKPRIRDSKELDIFLSRSSSVRR